MALLQPSKRKAIPRLCGSTKTEPELRVLSPVLKTILKNGKNLDDTIISASSQKRSELILYYVDPAGLDLTEPTTIYSSPLGTQCLM